MTPHLEGRDAYLAPDAVELAPPFARDAATARAQPNALPYHWLELSHLLLTHAADDFEDPDTVRRLLRDLREVRMSKLRKGLTVLGPGAGVKMNGVGGMEIAEVRGFVGGVVDGMRYVCPPACLPLAPFPLVYRVRADVSCRRINKSREESHREQEAEERETGLGGGGDQDDEDDDML